MNRQVRHYEPSRVVGLPAAQFAVVGVTFAPGYPFNLLRIGEMQARGESVALSLRRDPDNKADPNAVAVIEDATGNLLGHLPRGAAGRLAPLLDADESWEITEVAVTTIDYKPSQPGLRVRLHSTAPGAPADRHVDPQDLADLYVRIAALGPALQADLARRWQHSRLAGVEVSALTPTQLHYVRSLVSGFEAQARRDGVDLATARTTARRRLGERDFVTRAACGS